MMYPSLLRPRARGGHSARSIAASRFNRRTERRTLVNHRMSAPLLTALVLAVAAGAAAPAHGQSTDDRTRESSAVAST
jgi:hypothetical protein